MGREKYKIIRSPEVKVLLERKSGFLLGYGNLLFFIFTITGILASKALKYPTYGSYELHFNAENQLIENSNSLLFIKVPLVDSKKFNLRENSTKIYLESQGQVSELGILGTQIELRNGKVFYDVIITNQEDFSNLLSEKSLNKVLVTSGETSLFEQFFSQFKKKV